ncbi:acyl carrier protein [Spirillospora sp. CA-108201]
MTGRQDLRRVVLDVITAIHPSAGQVSERTTFTDLGFDSLDRITLAVQVENATGKQIPDPVLPGLRTVADLLHHLQGASA